MTEQQIQYELTLIDWLNARLEKCLQMDMDNRNELIKLSQELKAKFVETED